MAKYTVSQIGVVILPNLVSLWKPTSNCTPKCLVEKNILELTELPEYLHKVPGVLETYRMDGIEILAEQARFSITASLEKCPKEKLIKFSTDYIREFDLSNKISAIGINPTVHIEAEASKIKEVLSNLLGCNKLFKDRPISNCGYQLQFKLPFATLNLSIKDARLAQSADPVLLLHFNFHCNWNWTNFDCDEMGKLVQKIEDYVDGFTSDFVKEVGLC